MLAVGGILAYIWLDYRNDSIFALISGILAVFAGLAGLVGLIIGMCMALPYKGADVKAQLINREYGTDYTRDEVFYASSVIDIIRELDRKRYEINGDIRRQRDPQRDRHQQK